MSQQTENLHVRRTRKLLRDALIELIEERGFDRLTVTEITERAMVSRASFYRSNWSKYQLVEQIFEEATATLFGTIADDERQPIERWTHFFEHIAAYARLYRALLGKNGSPWFAAKMRTTLAEMIAKHLDPAQPRATHPSPGPPDAVDFITTILAGMFVDSIAWWLEHGRSTSAEEMARRTGQLASAMLEEASGWATYGDSD